MSPQLTLQTPLKLSLKEIPSYLDNLWSKENLGDNGANTFCLVIWQPAWIEQELGRTGKITSPVVGNQREEIIDAARKVVLEKNLPHITPPLDKTVINSLSNDKGDEDFQDLRGQHIDSDISTLQPRRLITLAPTLKTNRPLEALVAAYCPLPEERGGSVACGDVVVLRGSKMDLNNNLSILNNLLPKDLPSWIWWNGRLDEAPELLKHLAEKKRRLIIDSAIGDPKNCIEFLQERISIGQAVNDLNWLRLRTWRETLAMVFDPPERREYLNHIRKLDIDIEGYHPVQGLLFCSWMADKLNWEIKECNNINNNTILIKFVKSNKDEIICKLISMPIGNPSIHPGQIIGIRLISKVKEDPENAICVILASESGECMRLESGGMANMDLLEEVVPTQNKSPEKDVARLLSSSRGTTSPLLSTAAPIAAKLLKLASNQISNNID